MLWNSNIEASAFWRKLNRVGKLVQPTDHKLIDGCTAEDTAAWRWQFPVGIASFLNCTLFDSQQLTRILMFQQDHAQVQLS